MHISEKNMNALTVIDAMIGSLSRIGSNSRREVVCSFKTEVPTWLSNIKLRKLLGLRQMTTRPTDWQISEGISIREALYLTRSVLEVLNDGIPKFKKFPVEDQLGLYVQARTWASNKFLSYSKYLTVWPLAKYLHQDLPEKPEGFPCHPLVFTGAVRRLLKGRLMSKSDKAARLFWGYLQGVKRACMRANDSDIFSSYVKHHNILSTPPNQEITYNFLKESFSGLVTRSLKGFKTPKNPQLYEASTSASYESKRSLGGQREDVRLAVRNYRVSHNLPNEGMVAAIVRKDAVLMDTELLTKGEVEVMSGQIPPSFEEVLYLASTQPEMSSYSKKTWSKKVPRVKVQAILEPLKIRLISKGNSLNYYISKFFQKAMWEYLQVFPQFALTGRVIDTSDLYGILDKEKSLELDSFDHWVSGDYSSATDNVDIRMTMMVFEEMLGKTPKKFSHQIGSKKYYRDTYGDKLKEILRSVIGPQKISYPVFKDRTKEDNDLLSSFVQKNGQLMGSPLSFPILCMINIVCYWKALEEYTGRKFKMKDLPVLINGDDILFRANDEFYSIWKKWVAVVGFKLSLGKNYYSKDYLTINSKLFRYTGNKVFKSLGYLNVGLLTGQSKHGNAGETKTLWDMYNVCIEGSIDPERTRKRFFHYQKKDIFKFTRNGNYNCYVPRERGGLGFNKYPGQTNRLTNFQRRLATVLEQDLEEKINTFNSLKISRANNSLGIIVEGGLKEKTVSYERTLEVMKQPKMGPLPEFLEDFKQDQFVGPILMSQKLSEGKELKIKSLYRFVKTIRKNHLLGQDVRRMKNKEIYSYPFRLVEDSRYRRDFRVYEGSDAQAFLNSSAFKALF